ncbi:biotin/lipoyl-containing protein [Nocardiopsis coralliicola]
MSREQTFLLPDLGEGLTEATVLDWRVAPGDRIARDEPLVELETAKSAVEVPSPFTGTVARLHAELDEVVAVGAPLVTVTADGSPDGAGGAAAAGAPAAGIVGTVPDDGAQPARRVRLRPPEDLG